MKRISSLFVLYLAFNQTILSQGGARINGVLKDSDQNYIVLTYNPRLRGNLNFDGFRSTGTYVDESGYFDIKVDSLTDGAAYSLEFYDQGISLVLFEGDSIYCEINNNPEDPMFFSGIGAGKNNVLKLPDLSYNDNYNTKEITSLDGILSYVDSIELRQRRLITAIFNQDTTDQTISGHHDKSRILNIMSRSPLSKREYHYVVNRINLQRVIFRNHLIQQLSELKEYENVFIDFDHPFFTSLDNYSSQIIDLNHWWSAGALDAIIKFKYLIDRQEKGFEVTYGNYTNSFHNTAFNNWSAEFIDRHFSDNVIHKYHADNIAFQLTSGYPYDEPLDRIGGNSSFQKRIVHFRKLLEDGLMNEDYALDDNNLILDSLKFSELLAGITERPTYLIFWSARFAGATVVRHLPAIEALENQYKNKIRVLNICIDEMKYRNLWAARIIDNSWNSQHYFMPTETNENSLHNFTTERISSFCYGGVKYVYKDANGKITETAKGPLQIPKDALNDSFSWY
ncbi:MAG: hypothetical protein DHS20C17_12270 [Cyclobacteriaceae bacterium]|nr:MAG: hypothetical protein DHS20C17_12270 [Cyclobacteriaceae bacterium]